MFGFCRHFVTSKTGIAGLTIVIGEAKTLSNLPAILEAVFGGFFAS